ncbi:MAG: S1 RNA-binding domain-containing protein, partial [Muribaculaceae bacterium]|nr:S1 RNA-binding domain-containing protein [Muribaculaceae bacterium]
SPSEVLHLGERVMVKVIGVDFVRKRISLSLRGAKA